MTAGDKPPRFCDLRIAFWEYFFSRERAATLRWRRRNAEQPKVCACGAPGVTKVFSPGPVMGSVLPFWWRCDEHATVPLGVPWMGGEPQWHQCREECTWTTSHIDSGLVTSCGCGTHVGESR